MSLLRALRLPFQMASLLFVAFVAVLNLFIGGEPQMRPMRLVSLYLLLSWLNKYALELLQLAANGSRHAPVASAEMLGPFGDPRALIHPTIAAGVFLALSLTDSVAAEVAAVVAGLLIPASLAALAVAPHAIDTINPVVLWRVIRGLGAWYLWLLLAAAGCTLILWALYGAPGPALLRFTLSELLVLGLYAFIGGAIHHRRLEIGFEPIHSPERDSDRQQKAHDAEVQRVAFEFYGAIRARDLRLAAKLLLEWLAGTNGTQLALDVETLIQQAAKWPEQKGLLVLLRTLCAHAVGTRQSALAVLAAEAGVRHLPAFCVETAAETETLAQFARRSGRRRLAATLIDNFAPGAPDGALPESLRLLRAELAV
jgi:hypothetical protein